MDRTHTGQQGKEELFCDVICFAVLRFIQMIIFPRISGAVDADSSPLTLYLFYMLMWLQTGLLNFKLSILPCVDSLQTNIQSQSKLQ